MPNLSWLLFALPLAACASDPNYIDVQLAPEVISSIDGTLAVHALVYSDTNLVGDGKAVTLSLDYTDRNGTARAIAPIQGTTDKRGAVDGVFQGLMWDGTGTVTATAATGTVGTATFAVLDRTPPDVTITPPAMVRVNQNATFQVHVTDEIGVSEVFFEASNGGNGGNGNRQRSTVVASGSTDAMVSFDYQANDTQVGQMVTFYALGSDLSSNLAAAAPVTVMITQ